MKRSPEVSTATQHGKYNDAEVAGPPSPENPRLPLPATVVMIPVIADTLRMRLLLVSAIKRLPEASTATLAGLFNNAEVAGPPSPEKLPLFTPSAPLPATVVMTPLDDTFRIRLLP